MSEKKSGEISKQTRRGSRRSRRGEFKSHAKFRSPARCWRKSQVLSEFGTFLKS
ncbi:MAG: hypothetical protein F6K58_16625 [Symploca sp. SIO2E9]|nr:hypothetical protein [Symploca sp. SIO2E9]